MGRPTNIILVLPGEASIKASYGPVLARRLRIELNSYTRTSELSLEYYPYEKITRDHSWVLVHLYTANIPDPMLEHTLDFVKGPAPMPSIQESQGVTVPDWFVNAWRAAKNSNGGSASTSVSISNVTQSLSRSV